VHGRIIAGPDWPDTLGYIPRPLVKQTGYAAGVNRLRTAADHCTGANSQRMKNPDTRPVLRSGPEDGGFARLKQSLNAKELQDAGD
jgi:hypothetical protein